MTLLTHSWSHREIQQGMFRSSITVHRKVNIEMLRSILIEICRPITVEDNVWLGGDVTILSGVTTGHDSVIGAGSVVTKSISPGVAASGNPCKIIRMITENDANNI